MKGKIDPRSRARSPLGIFGLSLLLVWAPRSLLAQSAEDPPSVAPEAGVEEEVVVEPSAPQGAGSGQPARVKPPGWVREDAAPAGKASPPSRPPRARPAPAPAPPPALVVEELDEKQVEQLEAAENVEEVEVEVVTATRTPQKIEEAPSIISVITREQIQLMGYRTLGEILRNTVGFEVNDNGHWPDTGARGINDRTTYGDKIQMLVDGHNMSWRQFNRNFHNPSWIAVEDIQRIEIIRGPGGALWGANALNGVVNIVTRDWSDLEGAEVTYGADHLLKSQFASARLGQSLGEVSVYASVSFYGDDADPLLAPIREVELLDGERLEVRGDDEEGISINLKAKYKSLSIWFHKSRYDTGAPLSTFSVLGGDDSRFVTDRHIARLRFQEIIVPTVDVSAEFDFDDYRFVDGTVYEGNPGSSEIAAPVSEGPGRFLRKMAAIDRRYEGRASVSWVPTLSLQALVGAEVEYLDLVRWYFPEVWSALSLRKPTFDNWHFGSYAQVQYTPFSFLGLTAGARLDWDEIYGVAASPRAAAVLRLPFGLHVKALFGSAFKGPSYHDLYYFRKNAFYGNPDVQPERAYTGEVEVGFKLPGWLDARVVGFYTRINDLIDYQTNAAGQPLARPDAFPPSQRPDADAEYSEKANREHVETAGFEAEAWIRPWSRLTINLQGTYREPKDHTGERLLYSARWTAGGSVTVALQDTVDLTFRGLGVGDKGVARRGFAGAGFRNWTAAEDPTLATEAYFVGTVVLRARELFSKHLTVQAKIDNITNLDYYDAGREVLYPQRSLQAMVWGTLSL